MSFSQSEVVTFEKTLEVNSTTMGSQGLGTSIQRTISPSLINSRDSLSYADIVASRRPGGTVSPTPPQISLESMQSETYEQKELADDNTLLSGSASDIPLSLQARTTSPPNIPRHHDSGRPTTESSDACDGASGGKGSGPISFQEASPNPNAEFQPHERQFFQATEPSY